MVFLLGSGTRSDTENTKMSLEMVSSVMELSSMRSQMQQPEKCFDGAKAAGDFSTHQRASKQPGQLGGLEKSSSE